MLGRGDIIVTNSIEIPNRKSHIVTFLASFAMVPKAQFVVHYIRNDEIISDRLEIDLGEDLQNFVRYFREFSKTSLKPIARTHFMCIF